MIIIDEGHEDLASDRECFIFKNYVCYASRTGFFELYQILRGYIGCNGDREPELWFAIDEKIKRRSRVQKALATNE